MRELLLLRHAKSRWDEPETADHDRGLAPRGVEASRRMGELIARRGWLPDLVLCSTALRARQTLALAIEAWPKAPPIPIRHDAQLYLAAPGKILEICRGQADDRQRLLLVGHNPGLQSFIIRLAGAGERGLRHNVETKLPTAALARLTVDLARWDELGWGMACLADFETPRDMKIP